jgi:iron complex transport system substrate-binding protein
MKRSALLLALLLVLAACGADTGGDATTTVGEPATTAGPATTVASTTSTTTPAFPVTVEADNGPVTIEDIPEAIVSLSSTGTEMLFAIGAGDQVVAVDDQSNYPEDAPITDLSGLTPNVEAILSYEPDLVVISYDPGELVTSLEAAGVPVLFYDAALTLDDTYRQIEALGTATGHVEDAIVVNESIQTDLDGIVADSPEVAEGTSYYHEIDNTFYTATSTSFIGQIYAMFGMDNIADPADADGAAFGYPQLSAEFIVSADPDLIFLADSFYGESPETVAARPGWDVLAAVQEGNVVPLDSDVVSRWGPRVVDFAQDVSDALTEYAGA